MKNQPPKDHEYNPEIDKLHFGVYGQSFETWWYDNDGDKHFHSIIYANLRFYEDGTIIGIRSSTIPKIDVRDSFTMKGNWALVDNKLTFHLDKVSAVEDSIAIQITEADKREMKYYGEIADDNIRRNLNDKSLKISKLEFY